MLLLCVTGLPLIFSHEINHLLGNEVEAPIMSMGASYAGMDAVVASAKKLYPDRVVQYVFRDEDEKNSWTVSLGTTPTSEDDTKFVTVDARTTEVLQEPKFDEGFMYVMFKLHVDMFAGLPGMLFLGLMGVLLLVAIVSGVVLYAPFMRRLSFGEIRHQRGEKLKCLDVHNFLGVITLVWLFVVGLTGVINAWSELVVSYWKIDQMAEMTAPYKGLLPPKILGSLEKSVQIAQKLEPNMTLAFIAFPGTAYTSQHHYGVFMRGDSPVTARLYKPVLVDAKKATLTDSRDVPWYLAMLLISQPLHFGDYGGMFLKLLWTIFDLLSIVVLWTGLKLWWKKRNQYVPDIEARIALSEAY